MQVSRSEKIVQGSTSASRCNWGWAVVFALTGVELLGLLLGQPSGLQRHLILADFAEAMEQHVRLVRAFSRCAASYDAGTGLMLGLLVTFFPCKLVALFVAHPGRLVRVRGVRKFGGLMYLLFIAFMTALPVFMYLARLSPQESGLASINRKTSALCQGGFPAFHTAMFYSGFALVASYISIVIFVGLGRHFFDRDSRNA